MAENTVIKKIRCSNNHEHLIEAAQLTNDSGTPKTYGDIHSEIEAVRDLANGVVDTYVIKTDKSKVSGYDNIVKSTENTIESINITTLNGLVNVAPVTGTYHVGDIILMEAVSGDDNDNLVFDRWVSEVTDTTVSLTVLETQVTTHHHTLGVTTSKAFTGVSSTTKTQSNVAKVGESKSVLTGASGLYITSVEHVGGGYDINLTDASGDGSVSHSHSISAHTHSITMSPKSLVSENISVVKSLTSATHTPHTHTTTSAAGAYSNASAITYANGNGGKETFIKSLTYETDNTSSEAQTTGVNSEGLTTTTTTIASGDAIDDHKTSTAESHSHSVTTTTDVNVITSVTLPTKVITSVSHTKPSVQTSVVTSVSRTLASLSDLISNSSANFFNSATVDSSGVLIFGTGSAVTAVTTTSDTVVTSISVSRAKQTTGGFSYTSSAVTYTSGTVTATGTAASAGSHSHGFNHTHAIPSHTHGIVEHSHTYSKSVQDATGSAYVSLSTSSHTPHTHENITVIGTATNSSPFTYIKEGSTTSVVKNLVEEVTYTTTEKSLTTDTKYVNINVDIDFPGVAATSNQLSLVDITPAVDGGAKAITSILFSNDDFVTAVTTTGSIKTSKNIGGK